jgi:putative NADH-flavin reductase
MRIAVIGATGGTGRELVRQGLGHGHDVVAFSRSADTLGIEHERLTTIAGDVLSGDGLSAAVRGAHAVLFTVGGSGIRGEIRVYSDGVHNVIGAMREFASDRLVAVTAAGVGVQSDPEARVSLRLRYMRYMLRDIYADMERMEDEIMLSDVNWTIVRPAGLTDGPLTGEYRVAEGRTLPGGSRISRADLAAFMLKALGVDLWDGKGVAIAY